MALIATTDSRKQAGPKDESPQKSELHWAAHPVPSGLQASCDHPQEAQEGFTLIALTS